MAREPIDNFNRIVEFKDVNHIYMEISQLNTELAIFTFIAPYFTGNDIFEVAAKTPENPDNEGTRNFLIIISTNWFDYLENHRSLPGCHHF